MLTRRKAVRDWKTTVITIVGVALTIVGAIWPDKFDPETQETIRTTISEIVLGVGILINAIIGVFATTDTDT